MRKALFIALGMFAASLAAIAGFAATAGSARGEASASPQSASAAERALIRCGRVRSLGFLGPFTGPAASLGAQQRRWVRFYVNRHNRVARNKIRLVFGDTKLGGPGGTAEAVRAGQFIQGNARVLAAIGPAGSQEVVATTPGFKRAGLAYISGSATRTTLTTDGERTGYFFRVVPPDAVQSRNAATYILNVLRARRIYVIDDQSVYSRGLADEASVRFRAAGATVTRQSVSQQESNFAALIAGIPRNTQVVYIPWQLPPRGQAFGRQMQQAGRGNITLFGGDGLYDPAFASVGRNVYTTSFPVAPADPVIRAYRRTTPSGDFFGAPSYVAAQVAVQAITRACANGTATRAEVRRQIRATNIRRSLIGLRVRFTAGGDIRGGRFGVYRSQNGNFVPVG